MASSEFTVSELMMLKILTPNETGTMKMPQNSLQKTRILMSSF